MPLAEGKQCLPQSPKAMAQPTVIVLPIPPPVWPPFSIHPPLPSLILGLRIQLPARKLPIPVPGRGSVMLLPHSILEGIVRMPMWYRCKAAPAETSSWRLVPGMVGRFKRKRYRRTLARRRTAVGHGVWGQRVGHDGQLTSFDIQQAYRHKVNNPTETRYVLAHQILVGR